MRLLLDIKVLLDVVFERPGAAASSAVIRSCSREHEAWISWHSLAVAVAAITWAMNDFEDALQAAAALACDAAFIITRNEKDFAASPVQALAPEAFLAREP